MLAYDNCQFETECAGDTATGGIQKIEIEPNPSADPQMSVDRQLSATKRRPSTPQQIGRSAAVEPNATGID